MLSPGKPAELQRKESTDRHPFQHGDKVKCLLDIDILREMQEGHGGWNPKMAEVRPWMLPWIQFQPLPRSALPRKLPEHLRVTLKSAESRIQIFF